MGPSHLPDAEQHAYRKDLADVALAGKVIASHYAEPVSRRIEHKTELRARPSPESEVICSLGAGDPFLMLEDTVGWAWGYAGGSRRVGYVTSDALSA